MEDNLEIYFCEICSESIPAKDLTSQAAIELRGKVIGPCCLAEIRQPTSRGGISSLGLTAVGAVVLAAIAGATIHLEWRQSEQARVLTEEIHAVSTRVASRSSQHMVDLEKGLDQTLQQGALAPLEKQLGALGTLVATQHERVTAKFGSLGARIGGIDESQRAIIAGQSSVKAAVKEVENEVLRLEREVANAAAAPRAAVAEASAAERDAEPGPIEPVDAGPALPASLNHQVTRLKDADAGNRFEAVDQLIQSKEPAVLPYLLPMLKDSDAFVRRLTAEGLAAFSDATTVDALLVALADPEGIVRHTAHASLRKLTKQSIVFDPDGSGSSRAAAQRRWKEWWAQSRAAF